MRPDPHVLLADVDRAAADIARFTDGMDSGAYAENALDAGRGRTQVRDHRRGAEPTAPVHPELAERILLCREVVDFRNLLIHGYAIVIPDRVWDYAENYLPELRRIVQVLLDELGPPGE